MNKPIDIFRNTFIYSFGIILLGSLSLRIYPFLFALFTTSEPLNVVLWGANVAYGSILLGLFALIVPWLLLSFYGEFFYTRSFNRKEIFELIKNQHIKYLSVISVLLVISTYFYNKFSNMSGDKIYFNSSAFFISLTIYISLIIAGNTNTLKKILLYGIPLFVIFAFSSSYYIGGYDITRTVFWILWIGYLTITYRIVAFYNNDIDLNVPGKADDENRALANMWLFNKEFGGNNVNISSGGIFSKFNMLTSHTANIYKQLFLIMNTVFFFFAIRFSYGYFLSGMGDYYEASQGNALFLAFLSFSFMGIFIFINPKFIVLQGEEFLFTRAVSKGKVYLNNFIYQGIFILLLASLNLLIPNLSLALSLNMVNILLLGLWFYIAGEMGIIILVALNIFDFTFTTLNAYSLPSINTSLIVNIISPTIYTVFIWASAVAFRISDYLWFSKKEIGFIKEWKQLLSGLSKLYIPTFLLCFSTVLFATYSNPFTKFVTEQKYSDTNEWFIFNQFAIQAIFKNERNTYEEAIYQVIKEPYNSEKYLKLSRDYYINNLNYYSPIYYRPYKRYQSAIESETSLSNISTLLLMADSLKDTPEYLYQKSIVERNRNNYKEALSLAISSTEKSNDNNYLYNLAKTYEHELMNKEAIETYSKIFQSNTHDFKVLRKIGDIYWNNKEYNKAIDTYTQATQKELSVFPYKNYYSLGLCNQLEKAINIDDPITQRYIKSDLLFYSPLCFNNKIKGKDIIESSRYNTDDYQDKLYTIYLDKARKAENDGNLNKAEETLKKHIYMSEKFLSGQLALIQIKLDKKSEAEKTIDKYLSLMPKLKERFKDQTFDIRFTDYNSDLFKAMLILNKYPDKELTAEKMLLSAYDTEQAFKELKGLVDSEEIKKLEILKNQYDELYTYFEYHGLSMIKNNKTIEITSVLLNKLQSKDKDQFSELTEVLQKL